MRLVVTIMSVHTAEATFFSSPGACDLPVFQGMV